MTTPETEGCNPDCRAQWENWKKANHIQVWKAGELLPVRFRMQGLSLSPLSAQSESNTSAWFLLILFFFFLCRLTWLRSESCKVACMVGFRGMPCGRSVRVTWCVLPGRCGNKHKEKPTETEIKDVNYYGGGHSSPSSPLSVLAFITRLAKALM